jgi:integrase
VLRGIGRLHGVAQTGVDPVCVDELRAMVSALDDSTPAGLRDRALLVLGFAGAFRRSELVALEVADLAFGVEGLTVTIRRSKVDQEGEGEGVGLPYGSHAATCPVRTVRRWLDAAGIVEGPVFRSVDRHGNVGSQSMAGRSVALIVKRAAEGAGLDPARFSGHSLRAGLATSAAQAGKSERTIMRQGRWRSVTTARRYIRDADLYRDNAAAGIGL